MVLFLLFIVLLVIYFFVQRKAGALKKKVNAFGNLIGKTKPEMLTLLGKPTTTVRENNQTIFKWTKGGYALTLTFDAADKVVNVNEIKETFWS